MLGFTSAKASGRLKTTLVLAPLALLMGCGVIQDRSENYKQARLGSELVVPEGLDGIPVEPAFPIPDGGTATAISISEGQVPPPPDLTANILEENYVVESAGEQAWLMVNELPGQVWPAVARFLLDQGLELEHENPRIGLMQTSAAGFSLKAREWLGLEEAQQGRVTLVQAKVSPGVRRRTTEVQVRLRQAEAGSPREFMQWTPETGDSHREVRLLEDMAQELEEREAVKSYSRAALDIAEEPRIRLIAPEEGSSRIEMDVSYERGWSEVSRALEDTGAAVVDIDRSAGLWYVDFRSEDERTRGWLFWKRLDEPEFTYQVELQRSEAGHLTLTTRPAPDYQGNDRSRRLLSEIFEFLY